MEMRNTPFWFSPGGIVLLLGSILIIVFAGFLAYRPIARAYWIGHLTDESSKVAQEAHGRVLAMGVYAIPSLMEMLEKTDPMERTKAAVLLDELAEEHGFRNLTIPFWMERLFSIDPKSVAMAKEHLAAMPETSIDVVTRLFQSPEIRKRFAAYEILRGMKIKGCSTREIVAKYVPHDVILDYEFDKIGFPRGKFLFEECVTGKKVGEIVVVTPPRLANVTITIPEEKDAGYMGPLKRNGYDAVMRGNVICIAEARQIEQYRYLAPGAVSEPPDEAGMSVRRKISEMPFNPRYNENEKDIAGALEDFTIRSEIDVVLDPMAMDVASVTFGGDEIAGDTFLNMITLPRRLSWTILGNAVVVFEPTGDSARFSETVIEGTWREFPDVVKALESQIDSVSYVGKLGDVLKELSIQTRVSIVSLPSIDTDKPVNIETGSVPFRHALDYIVKVKCGYRWIVSDGALVVQRSGQPEPLVPLDLDASEKDFPEVVKALRTRSVPMYLDGSVAEAAEMLQQRGRIHIFLDPTLREGKNLVSVQLPEMKLSEVLTHTFGSLDLKWDVRYGGVYVASAEKLADTRKTIDVPNILPGKLRAKLEEPLEQEFVGTSLSRFVERLKRLEVPISIGAAARARGAASIKVSCKFEKLKIRHVLEAVLRPVDLKWRYENGEIVIVPR
ncbi:MAG: hypothetical protein ACYS8W_07645 [Planctomycetota bacterium]|jgi:hypothetical protein